jgi:hypothetical protein
MYRAHRRGAIHNALVLVDPYKTGLDTIHRLRGRNEAGPSSLSFDLDADARADRASTLADSKRHAFFHRHRLD